MSTIHCQNCGVLVAAGSSSFERDVSAELAYARTKHGKITGLHDGYGRMKEEVDEFWDEVKKKHELRDYKNIRKELIQVAAMAQRIAEDLYL